MRNPYLFREKSVIFKVQTSKEDNLEIFGLVIT